MGSLTNRTTRPCSICGRPIYFDHNLSRLNYDRHVDACPKQLLAMKKKEGRAYVRKMKKMSGDGAVPMIGQLGFPFPGVPGEVGG